MELTILRHMQTPYNEKGILQGQRDIGILSPGPDQTKSIETNKEKLGDLTRFDFILLSSLRRTRETARLYTPDFLKEPLLDELDFGHYEGRPKADLLREQPHWESDPRSLILGEPLIALMDRVKAFADKYQSSDRILAFGHGAWIRAMAAWHSTGSIKTMNQIYIPNNKMMQYKIQRRPK